MDPKTLFLIGAGVAGLVVFYLVAKSTPIRFRFKVRKDFLFEEFETERIDLPFDALSYFDQTHNELSDIGFEHVGHFLTSEFADGVTIHFALYANHQWGDVAYVSVIYASVKDSETNVVVQEQSVCFGTGFQDGLQIDTNNSACPPFFPRVNFRKSFQFRKLNSVSKLYSVHCKLVGKLGQLPRRPIPSSPEQWKKEAREELTLEFREQLETGCVREDDTGQFYMLTWKGSLMMTAATEFPFEQILNFIQDRRARKLIREFGIR